MPTPPTKNLPDSARQIAALADSAAALARRGETAEAAKVYEEILSIAPYHQQTLNFLAMRAFEDGNLERSLALLERSVRAPPALALPLQNLGLVHKACGEYEPALEALDRALALRPVFPMALLHRGSVLEHLGRHEEAVCDYLRAWTQDPTLQASRHSEATPAPLRTLIAHSAERIHQARLVMLDEAFAPLRAQHDSAARERLEQFAAIYLGIVQPRYRHALQRPALLYFPDLEPRAFFNRRDFDWIEKLESATPPIRAELRRILQQEQGLPPYVQLAESDPAPWQGLNHSRDGSAYHLYKGGVRDELNCRHCPATTAAIEELPLVQTPDQSPEIFFSILKPGAHIPPHHGLANYKVAVHLPLIIPEDCAIRVGNETRAWSEGECLIFDDSFQHEAWNRSNQSRAVLILEVWNPQLTAVERQAVSAVLAVIHDFDRRYGGAAPATDPP